MILFMQCFSQKLTAQNYYLPIDNQSLMRQYRAGLPAQEGVHFGAKPILRASADVNRVAGLAPDTADYFYWITTKLFSESLIEVEKKDFLLSINPLFDFSYGQEILSENGEKQSLYTNTRGFTLSAKIGNSVYLYTDFLENQARFPDYLNRFVDSLEVVPGSGRVKDFKVSDFDYNMASGYVAVDAADWLSLSLGHSKQFVGHGYRSLLLSDNAFNLPFLSYTTRFFKGKLQYRYTISLLQNLLRLPAGDTPESIFQRKFISSQYLSYKPWGNVELGLFESTLWKLYDRAEGTQPFEAASLNPVPLLNAALYGFDDTLRNVQVGFNAAWTIFDAVQVYGQVLLDDPSSSRYGYQLGARYAGLLQHFDLQVEYNAVEEGTYQSNAVLQAYSHYNQPLAHPFGAGFTEYMGMVTYYRNRVFMRFKYIQATFDETGRDILEPYALRKSNPTEAVSYQNVEAAYIFNPKTNMQVYAGFTNRTEDRALPQLENQFWYLGFRTNLANIYTDF